ncbi:MAG: putative lipoprotein, partial [Myxococcaceae bacterium]|nr:putative lipoprotein [Myxococcaceae bacterium]
MSGISNVTIRFCWVGLLVVTAACSSPPGFNDGGRKDGGEGEDCNATKKCAEGLFCLAGKCTGQFSFYDLDDAGPQMLYLSMALQADAGRVGIAYFAQVDAFGGTYGADGGLADGYRAADGGNTGNYEIRYVEWNNGVASPPQMIRTVQRVYGVSVAFQQNGEPAVAYLGGGADMSAYWYQSDAVVAYRSGGNTWTENSVATRSDQSPCGSPLDIGFLVGLFPSLVFDGPKAYLSWRDGHNGQFPQQDWAGSDLKISEGGPTAWTTRCQMSSGNIKYAYGARTQMVMANGQPAVVHDRAFGGA